MKIEIKRFSSRDLICVLICFGTFFRTTFIEFNQNGFPIVFLWSSGENNRKAVLFISSSGRQESNDGALGVNFPGMWDPGIDFWG